MCSIEPPERRRLLRIKLCAYISLCRLAQCDSHLSPGVPSACSAFRTKSSRRMKYSEVIHTNKKFDEKAWGRGSSAKRQGATGNTPVGDLGGAGDSIWKTLSTQDRVRLLDFTTARSSTTCKVSPWANCAAHESTAWVVTTLAN
jgi:hypothetical protein